MTKPVTAWSYSRFACYDGCPAQFKYRYIDKLPEPESAAMGRGDKIHKGVASYLKGGESCPPEAQKNPFQWKLVNELRVFDDKVVEEQWAFNRSWSPTGWFGKETYFRQIADAAVLYEDYTAEVIDWKTGKKYSTAEDQHELSALALMRHFKPATHVTTRFVYLDLGSEEIREFPSADQEKLMAKWDHKAAPMLSDTTFMPRPSGACTRCHFSRSNGGPCRYG